MYQCLHLQNCIHLLLHTFVLAGVNSVFCISQVQPAGLPPLVAGKCQL